MKKNKKKMLLFKIDFEKAYDSVDWKFLDHMLDCFGFEIKWRSWIKGCLYSARSSVLINGSPTKEFPIKRGLRQASGLRINVSKSHLFGVGVGQDDVIRYAANTGCKVGVLPTKYIGLPISANMNYIVPWNDLVNKFNKRLAAWKVSLLSFGARLTLIKFIMGSLGSLNNGSLKAFNMVLVLKWKLRFLTSGDMLWSKVIKALHGDSFERSNVKGVWDNIVNYCAKMFDLNLIPKHVIMMKLGDGSSIRFGRDLWIGDTPLHISHNRLFHLERGRDVLVANI
ncbi:uncharacterized protein [Rutidosis leptorrhynchoides]|uniref:uncharacterized protein n=1 Tax=Rutidosis leptorrhynchoides TaxID=125765 RepID=UPI003A9A3433